MGPDPDPIVDHQGLEVLSTEECWQLIRIAPLGRIAYIIGGEPMVLPVNHGVVGHRVVLRTARGAMLHEALMDQPVAFEVDGFDVAARRGWSVVVRGQATIPDATEPMEELDLDTWADAVDRTEWVSISAEEVTGRRITRS